MTDLLQKHLESAYASANSLKLTYDLRMEYLSELGTLQTGYILGLEKDVAINYMAANFPAAMFFEDADKIETTLFEKAAEKVYDGFVKWQLDGELPNWLAEMVDELDTFFEEINS